MLCFTSDFLERKLQGLKSIIEMTRNIRKHYYKVTHMTLEQMVVFHLKFFFTFFLINFFLYSLLIKGTWLNSNKIFEILYGVNSHNQLIQRSSDFLKFMINVDFLTKDNLELLWGSTLKGDSELKISIYKVNFLIF